MPGLSGPLDLNVFLGRERNREMAGAIVTPTKSYYCANFGENRSRNATVRVPTDGYTH